ncbi:MAG TPA: hypothetical protein PLB91_13015 [Spirochaetales bacterium]|nr:hypothetical protein [Spirochaetales bacterium]HRY54791.1 hypothetical protein [Spirochaetia bacterium]HRZ64799.1 hypothetical protein [Spirochaetia bacterium]
MKKLFVLLLALIVAASAFAQLTVAGYDKAKATFNSDSKEGAYSDEIRFNLTAKDADGKYGFSGRFQGTSGTYTPGVDIDADGTNDDIVNEDGDAVVFAKNDFVVKYMYGWASFFDGMLKLSAGRINEGGYQFGANEANSIQGNLDSETDADFVDIRTQSMELTVAPMAGLSASVIYTPNDTITGTDLKYGVAYSVENLLNVKAMMTGNAAGDILGTFGAEFVGVENLSAVAGLKLDNDGTDPVMAVYSIVGYTMDALFFEVAGQYLFETDLVESGYYFEGNAEYTVETYSVRAFGQYNDKMDLAEAGNEYLIGAELSIPVGSGEFNAGFNYGDATKVSVPVYLKIAF